MSIRHTKLITLAIWMLGFCLGAALPALAQVRGGGFTGGAAGGTRSSSGGTSRQYNNNSTIGDAIVSSDPETRRLIVITDEETSQFIGQVVTNLDRPKPQVLIKVVFLEVTHNDATDIGVEGGFSKTISAKDAAIGGGANVFGLNGVSGLTNINPLLPMSGVGSFYQPISQMAAPGAGVYQILGQDYQVTLRAIAQAGKAKVLSRPSILARNNQPATILVGQSVPLITSVSYGGLNGLPINSFTYSDVGIILRVTPFITADGMVEMIVSPEISTVSKTDFTQISLGATAPFIDKRSADTVVVTPDGQTVVIGGLMQNQKAVSESKIPLLGDIPWLGALFKRKVTADSKTELVIFLTPHIVYAPTQLAALSDKERNKSKAVDEFTEEQLNRFLDGLPVKEPEATTAPPSSADGKKKPAKSGKDVW